MDIAYLAHGILGDQAEAERFDNHATKVQQIIDDGAPEAYDDADLHLAEMRDLFFGIPGLWRISLS